MIDNRRSGLRRRSRRASGCPSSCGSWTPREGSDAPGALRARDVAARDEGEEREAGEHHRPGAGLGDRGHVDGA